MKIIIAIILSVFIGMLIGAGLTYLRTQKKIKQQKRRYTRQSRKEIEELEKTYRSRLQEKTQSLQAEHQNQLNQTEAELNQQHENRLQETINSMKKDHQAQLSSLKQKLEQEHESQLQETINKLKADYENRIQTLIQQSDKTAENNQYNPINPNEQDKKYQKEEELSQKIIAWGDSGKVSHIPQLTHYVYHCDSYIRQLIASALGKISADKKVDSEIQKAIETLGKLSQDSEALVRKVAVDALGSIKSEKVVPFLKQAMRDSDSSVVKSASSAMTYYKFYPVSRSNQPTVKKKYQNPDSEKKS